MFNFVAIHKGINASLGTSNLPKVVALIEKKIKKKIPITQYAEQDLIKSKEYEPT